MHSLAVPDLPQKTASSGPQAPALKRGGALSDTVALCRSEPGAPRVGPSRCTCPREGMETPAAHRQHILPVAAQQSVSQSTNAYQPQVLRQAAGICWPRGSGKQPFWVSGSPAPAFPSGWPGAIHKFTKHPEGLAWPRNPRRAQWERGADSPPASRSVTFWVISKVKLGPSSEAAGD